MSIIVIDALEPKVVIVNVSFPSVVRSEVIGIFIVAIPKELMTAFPLILPPLISEELTPVIAYVTDEPGETFVVVSVKTALEPSDTEFVVADNA